MANPIVNVNGEIIAPEQAKVSVFDRSFLYGDSLYEVARTYDGKFFGMREHLDRLSKSAELCHMVLGQPLETYCARNGAHTSRYFEKQEFQHARPTAASSSAAEAEKSVSASSAWKRRPNTSSSFNRWIRSMKPNSKGPQTQDRRAHPKRRARAGSRGENRKLPQLAAGLPRSTRGGLRRRAVLQRRWTPDRRLDLRVRLHQERNLRHLARSISESSTASPATHAQDRGRASEWKRAKSASRMNAFTRPTKSSRSARFTSPIPSSKSTITGSGNGKPGPYARKLWEPQRAS